ncbi:iron-containing alcohol dehydrogenase [Paenibacillus senegalensis]|uniref:iron-containing alcohol dehydrogenase n=1 Tax=Paenibacillus senegalensis TaxID=1465766 RepID=UPI0002F42E02|nr:iron-containing alcohol dehydrogenase [Paenibacillus senegalensis]
MNNFVFHNPTKLIFGKGAEHSIGAEARLLGSRVLLHYGGESVRKNGAHARVTQSLSEAGMSVVELSGVKPNPRLGLVREGIQLCREERIDLIVAVGGGSVIDSAKAIARLVLPMRVMYGTFSRKKQR